MLLLVNSHLLWCVSGLREWRWERLSWVPGSSGWFSYLQIIAASSEDTAVTSLMMTPLLTLDHEHCSLHWSCSSDHGTGVIGGVTETDTNNSSSTHATTSWYPLQHFHAKWDCSTQSELSFSVKAAMDHSIEWLIAKTGPSLPSTPI